MLAELTVLKNHAKSKKHQEKSKILAPTQKSLAQCLGTGSKEKNQLDTAVKKAELKLTGFLAEHNIVLRAADHLVDLQGMRQQHQEIAIRKLSWNFHKINARIPSEALSDKRRFPFFHPLLPKEGFQYPAIVQLLLYFRWNLMGLFASDTENGDNFMRTFPPMLVRNGICVVISQRFTTTGHMASLREALSKWRQINVFVHFMEFFPIWNRIFPFHEALMHLPGPIEGKVWILTNFAVYTIKKHIFLKYIHSIWNFAYLRTKRPTDAAFEPHFFVEDLFQDHYFHCSLSKHVFSVKGRRRCTQKAPLETQEKRNRKRIINDRHR